MVSLLSRRTNSLSEALMPILLPEEKPLLNLDWISETLCQLFFDRAVFILSTESSPDALSTTRILKSLSDMGSKDFKLSRQRPGVL